MFSASERRIGQGLAALCIVCLALCHGIFGALHLFSDPLMPLITAEEHVVGHGSTEEQGAAGKGDHAEQHGVGAGYFAVLLGFLVGGMLCLLYNARRWQAAPLLRPVGSCPPTVVPNLPRGPTAPLPQVFRL